MFKRIAKRQRRREKEEELGLDEEMKQVLGLQDTDSDESSESNSDSESRNDSDSDSSSGQDNVDEEDNVGRLQSLKRKRSAHALKSKPDSDDGDDFSDLEDIDSDLYISGDTDDDDGPPMDVMSATTNPIYSVPGAPLTQDFRACVVCPGKLLKHAKMVEVHLESAAHIRRLRCYTSRVSMMASGSGGLNTDDPRDILRDMPGATASETPDQCGVSKRSQRRNEWKAKRAERRRARSMAKAKITTHKAEVALTTVEVGDEPTEQKSQTTKSGKKPYDAEAISASIAVDPPATLDRRQRTRKGIKVKDPWKPDSEASTRGRPAKRLKRAHADTAPVDIKDRSGSQTNFTAKKLDGRFLEGERTKRPERKRRNTSYFADDEKHSDSPVRLSPRSQKATRLAPTEGKERKFAMTKSGTMQKRSSRRGHREGKSSASTQRSKRGEERKIDKNNIREAEVLYSVHRTQPGLSET